MQQQKRPNTYQPYQPGQAPAPLPPKPSFGKMILQTLGFFWGKLAWWGKALVILFLLGGVLNLFGYKSNTTPGAATATPTAAAAVAGAGSNWNTTRSATTSAATTTTTLAAAVVTTLPTATVKPTEAPKPTATPRPATLAPTPAFQIGDTITSTKNYSLVVTDMKEADKFDCQYSAGDGYEYVALYVIIANNNPKEEIQTGYADMTLKRGDGLKGNFWGGSDCKKIAIPASQTLKPGEKMQGWVTFLVPVGLSGLRFELNSIWYNTTFDVQLTGLTTMSQPTATPIPATATPLPPTATPKPVSELKLSASVSNPTPSDGDNETLTVHVSNLSGQPVAVPFTSVWGYSSKDSECDGTTNANGVGSCLLGIGGAKKGFTVTIDVTVNYNGQSYNAETSFTTR